ncbi:MAG: LamG-like jellyroll fold domain-containing protein [Nannocystales bacterium]
MATFLVPSCVGLNPAFEDQAEDGSGGETSKGTGGGGPTGGASTVASGSASGATGASTLSTGTGSVSDLGDGTATGSEVMPANWWDPDYRHRVELVFEPRDEALSGFVTYVPLNLSPSRLEGVTRSKLAFVDPNSNTRIPAEVPVLVPSAGELAAWVQLPVWRSDEPTSVFLYFGYSAPDTPSESPWSGHVAVWHMDELSGGGLTPDAAGSADAEQVDAGGSPLSLEPGIVGDALQFDGETNRLGATISDGLVDDTFLVSAWVLTTSYAEAGSPIIARGDRSGPSWSDHEWVMGFTPDRAEVRVHDDLLNDTEPRNAGVVHPELGWHHYAFLYTGSSIRLYVDGVSPVAAGVTAGMDHVLSEVSIGGYPDAPAPEWEAGRLEGRIDELRWRRGADVDGPHNTWVDTLYESQLEPETTFAVGPVEDLP